ncbi:MAG: VWA domain-containing protein [Bryobacteraceae bacterium]
MRLLALSAAMAVLPGLAQTPPAPAEVSSEDTPIVFQSRVNLVLVPAVVRDRSGKPVGTLRQEDFQLFDNGKPQVITKFSVERSGGKPGQPASAVEQAPAELAAGDKPPAVTPPSHFVAWIFDDVHLEFEDLVRSRDAAEKYLVTSFQETDRAAIYTTSGQNTLDFTDDRSALRGTLLQLKPRPIARSTVPQCPDIDFYMADRMINKNDAGALNVAMQEAMICLGLDPTMPQNFITARGVAQTTAESALAGGRHETQVSLTSLRELVRRMAAMPGQRTIVLVSPGFTRLDEQLRDETAIMDEAIRSNVTINALDARGLYTDTPDIAQMGFSAALDNVKQRYAHEAAFTQSEVMAELADGTGGTFFQNSNDLTRGIDRLSATPDVYYVLGYAPQNLKMDGAYHSIKVTVKLPPGLSTRARRGYYAPRHAPDAAEEAKEEISQALFSREVVRDIPVEMHTQFFKASEVEARLAVLARVDVRKLRFRKTDGRNGNEMTVVSGLFDRNGNFVQGITKTVTMRLKDETLAGKLNSGVTVRSDFKVTPGTYVIRIVVRDAEGQMMAAQNGAVEIP